MTATPLDLHNLTTGAKTAAGSAELLARRTGFTVRNWPEHVSEMYWTGKGPDRRPVEDRQLPIYVGPTATVARMLER